MGVPFAAGLLGKDKQGVYLRVTCPSCGTDVLCRDMKDFESFTRVEYVNHYKGCKEVL